MATTTLVKVRLTAAHLKAMADADLQAHIDDASLMVSDMRIPAKYLELAERYMAQHMATLNKRRPTSQGLSDLSVGYQATKGLGLQQTEFGQQFEALMKQIGNFATLEVM